MLEKIEQMELTLAEAKVEALKFVDKGNNTAGTRLRAKMQELKDSCQEIRKEVSEIKNSK
jgi:hypothetical protein